LLHCESGGLKSENHFSGFVIQSLMAWQRPASREKTELSNSQCGLEDGLAELRQGTIAAGLKSTVLLMF